MCGVSLPTGQSSTPLRSESMATRTVQDALDDLLKREESLRWLVDTVKGSEARKWAIVAKLPVESVCEEAVRDVALTTFSEENALLVEALLLKLSRSIPSSMRRYQANLRGAGAFPLEKMFLSLPAATDAVCAALNKDLRHLDSESDTADSTTLLPAFCGLVDDWGLESDWRSRLACASLLPDSDSLDSVDAPPIDTPFVVGQFERCSDSAIHFVESAAAGGAVVAADAPCVTVVPFDPSAGEHKSVRYAVGVAPVPRGRRPTWLNKSLAADPDVRSGKATYIFEGLAEAVRARSYFRLRSLFTSDVYTVDK